MKAFALFGGAGALTAILAGGPVAIALGNVAVMASSVYLLHLTTNLQKAN